MQHTQSHLSRWMPATLGLVILLLSSAPSQARRGEAPLTTPDDPAAVMGLDAIDLNTPDIAALKAAPSPDGVFQYAQPQAVFASPQTRGNWETTPDGSRVWRFAVRGNDATDLNLGFTRFQLPPDASLYVISTDADYYEGPYTYADNKAHGELWVPAVPGSSAIVELRLPAVTKFEPILELTHVGYGYRDLFRREHNTNKQGSCNVDTICEEGDDWRPQIASVGAFSLGGALLCTGTLVADADGSFRSLFLTAWHCGVNASNAASITVYWGYEADTCGDLTGTLAENQTGASLLASRQDVDFSLLELDSTPPASAGVYYSGWDRSGDPVTGAASIHHPDGEVKAIAIEEDELTTVDACAGTGGLSTHWQVDDWEDGVTESGSSGAGLWSTSNNLLIGILSGGGSACTGASSPDCFGKLSAAWDGSSADTRLRDWLDPSDTGAMTATGSFQTATGVVEITSFSFTDDCSGSNRVLEPGETADVLVNLATTAVPRTAVSATLSSSTAGVTIDQGTASWDDLALGTPSENLAPFQFSLDGSVACFSEVDFDLTITTAEGGPFVESFSIPVGQGLQGVGANPVPLVDDGLATDALSISEVRNDLTNINVRVELEHSWVGDLVIELVAPGGQRVTLLDRPGFPASSFGCSDDNMNITFSDQTGTSASDLEGFCTGSDPWFSSSVRPADETATMADLLASRTNGEWRLRITDEATGDTGHLVQWELLTTPPLTPTCAVCPPTQPGPTAIPDSDSLFLTQNFPNPFNPRTEIAFHLDRPGAVELAIFDAAGRRVVTLIQGDRDQGRHNVVWTGRDGLGQEVSSGVYFYRLTHDGRTEMKRMSLIR